MDISPRTLREVEFREKFRGYHTEDVDTFLERVAVAVDAMQIQIRQADERAERAEQVAAQSGSPDETLSRTLLLAQRTADMAIQEAQEEATTLLAEAKAEARALVAEAKERARRLAFEAQASVRSQVADLEETRGRLQADVDALESWIQTHRSTLSSSLRELLDKLERELAVQSPAPTVDPVAVPAPLDVDHLDAGGVPDAALRDVEPGDVEPRDVEPASIPAVSTAPAPRVVEAAAAWRPRVEEATLDRVPAAGDHDPGEAASPSPFGPRSDWGEHWAEQPLPEEATPAGGSDVRPDDDEPVEELGVGVEQGDEEIDQVTSQKEAEDPFMAELRRAVTDTEPLGPRDDQPNVAGSDVAEQSLHDDLDAGRFGSRAGVDGADHAPDHALTTH